MSKLTPVDYDPFAENPFDTAIRLEGVSDPKEKAFLRSIYQQESSSGKKTETSNRGATGGMQIIPETFRSVAEPDWDIQNPVHNARGGIRYARERYREAKGDPALAAAGYYGGPGGQAKAAQGIAVYDPRNPRNPSTLEYGQQVAARAGQPSAATPAGRLVPVDHDPFADEPNAPVPHFEIRGTSADEASAQPSRSLPQALASSFKSAGASLAAGAADVGATLLAPTDLLADWLSDEKAGTAMTSRRKAIEDFYRENTEDPDSLTQRLTRSVPELAVTASPLSRASQAAAKVASPVIGRLGGLAGDVLTNAGYGAGKSVYRSGKLEDAGEGAEEGAVGAVGGRVLAKVLGGARTAASEGMRYMTDRGYLPTIGEMGGKATQVYENIASHLPLFSSAVRRSEEQATRTYSRAETNRAIERLGGRTSETGEKAVKAGEDVVDAAYEQVKPFIQLTPQSGQHAVNVARTRVAQQVPLLSSGYSQQLDTYINNHILPRINARGGMRGGQWKDLDRELGKEARKHEKEAASAADENMGRALRILQRELRRALTPTANAPAGVLDDLAAANKTFHEMLAVRDAARRTPGHAGHFTPAEYAAAADRYKVQRGPGNEAIRQEAAPPAGPRQGTPELALKYGPPLAVAGYFGGGPLIGGLASLDPGTVLGTAAVASTWGAHQLANTATGRHLLYNGLSGLVPSHILDRISGLPAGQAAKAFRDLLARPEFANVAAQIGRQYMGERNAP